MPYLALVPTFVADPRIAALTDRQFRTWLRLLLLCVEQRKGELEEATFAEVIGATPATINRYVELGLLVRPNGSGVYRVHRYERYNGTLAGRVSDYLEQHPHASANEVVRILGGNRNDVLAAVRDFRGGGSIEN